MGCRVTAHDEQEALRILKEGVFRDYQFPRVKNTIKDVDISKLDQGHVRPNMSDPSRIGVWFPLGYA